MNGNDPGTLHHVTPRSNLRSIAQNGLKWGSFWSSNDDLTDHYAETVEDDGEEPAILAVALADLLALAERGLITLEPDRPGIEEPITGALGMSEQDVMRAWGAAAGTWRDSLAIIGSLRVAGEIPADLLLLADDDDPRLLTEAVSGMAI